MTLSRLETAIEDRWNVEALFPSLADWQKEFVKFKNPEKDRSFEEILKFKGQLGTGPETLKQALESIFNYERKLTTLYTYAHLRHDEEITLDETKTAYNKARLAIYEFQTTISWFQPELLSLSDATIQSYLNSPVLKDYHFYLEKIFAFKPHTLTEDQEELMAQSMRALSASHKAFSAINDADFVFDKIRDSQGKERELTHGKYAIYMRSQDRPLRETAFKTYHEKYHSFKNTLCELLEGQVQAHLFHAKARKFNSCLEAALFPNHIDPSVYFTLIQAVHEKIHVHHRYMNLRGKLLKTSPLHMYDLHVPLMADFDIRLPYKEAEDLVIDSTAPLGPEYQNILRKGLKDQRWVDRFENKNKRSGAYSSGCYDSLPYILMNYKDIIRDVFTLAHEAGHSMHSYFSHANQPYQYADYPIFLAEIASTFNEELLMQKMMARATTKEERIYLINQKIEDIRSTLFRQTMFAEFELKIHEYAEKGVPLTPKLLDEEYQKLNEFYFGPSVFCDKEIEIEWARIPHFYYNFYVFQYATGISAALALADKVKSGGDKEREDYLSFLKSGSSLYPIDLLLKAGIDMRAPLPVLAAIDKFDRLVTELEELTNQT
ncbi:Oligoendopeptidase F-like protein [Chlamydiales bacterium STE3]|nr:Oligoendopeptidase F-like protein [Chlamydiales bacterium STE3]